MAPRHPLDCSLLKYALVLFLLLPVCFRILEDKNRAKLTKRRIDTTKPTNSDIFLWCDATPGFGARVYPSGKVVFVAQVRVGRSQRRVKIGPYGPWTVEQARDEADVIIRSAGRGIDPQAEKRELRDAMTVSELCDAYMTSAQSGQVLTRFGRPKAKRTIDDDKGRIARHIKPLIGWLRAPQTLIKFG